MCVLLNVLMYLHRLLDSMEVFLLLLEFLYIRYFLLGVLQYEVKFCIREEHVFCSLPVFVSNSMKLNVLLNLDEKYVCGMEGKNCLLFRCCKV